MPALGWPKFFRYNEEKGHQIERIMRRSRIMCSLLLEPRQQVEIHIDYILQACPLYT